MKNSASSVHSARQHSKRSHRWPEKLQPKRLCQTIVTIDVSIHSSQREQPPSPPSTPPYPVFAFFLSVREVSLFLLFGQCLLCHWYGPTEACSALARPSQRPHSAPRWPLWYILFLSLKETLTFRARLVQTTSVLFCVHSAAFASHLSVCVSVCSYFSI